MKWYCVLPDFYLTPYMLQLTVLCSVVDRLRSFTQGRSRESNSTPQATPSYMDRFAI